MSEKPKTSVEICKVDDEAEILKKAIARQMDITRSIQGPGHIESSLHMTIQQCWSALPVDNKTIDELERQMQRLLKRAIDNMREDFSAFGWS